MKHLLIAVILISLIGNASAQKPRKWTRLKGPNEGNTTHILMFGSNNEIISQDTFGYFVTINDGSTWDYRKIISGYKAPSSSSYSPYSLLVTSQSGNYFFAFASAKDDNGNTAIEGIYKSTDFGSTWKMILKTSGISQLFAGDNGAILFLTGSGVLWESIDNGSSWVQVVANLASISKIVASNSNGIFINNNGSLYKIPNGGQSPVLFHVGIPVCNSINVVSLDNNLLLGMTCNTVYTSDGVNPWDSIGTYSNNIYAPIRGNGDTLTAIGYFRDNNNSYEYYVVMSTDRGKTWNSIGDFKRISPSGYTIIGNYANANKFMYEDSRGLFTSTDRGGTWSEIGLPYATINKVLVNEDGDKIFARRPQDSYHYAYYLDISENKGKKWGVNNPTQLSATNQIGKNLHGDIIAATSDSSQVYFTWIFDTITSRWLKQSAITDLTGGFYLLATDNSKYLYISAGASIYSSDDNGLSWSNVHAPDDANGIYSLDASSDGTVYFGTYPIMYRSEDHGATWTKLEPVHDITQLSYIKTFGAAGVLLGTHGDGLLLSMNKGDSWSRIDGNNFDTVTCIAINSKSEVAAGTNRGLWTSDVTKLQWTKVTLGSDADLYIGGIDVAANDDFYVGTYGSSVWMGTRNYNSVGERHNANSSMTLFPNPSSEKITIDINLADEEEARVELYDILGRKISVLADRKFSGVREINYNTTNLSDGLYTVLLISNGKTEAQKIVVAH